MIVSRTPSRKLSALAALGIALSSPAALAQQPQQDWRAALPQVVQGIWIGGGTVATSRGQAEVVCEGAHSVQPGSFVRVIQDFRCHPSSQALAHGQPLMFAPFRFSVWSDTTDGATVQGSWWENGRTVGRFSGGMSAWPYPRLTATIQVQGDGGRAVSASYTSDEVSMTVSSPTPGISQMTLRLYRPEAR